MRFERKLPFLGRIELLREASPSSLDSLQRFCRRIERDDGADIYRQGERPGAMYFLLKGEVRLSKDGEEVARLGPGDDFGGWGMVDDAPRVASATATAPCVLMELPKASLRQAGRCGEEAVRSIRAVTAARLLRLAGDCGPCGEED